MRVLVSQRVVVGPYGDPRDALEHTYVAYLERHGIVAVPVSNAASSVEPYAVGIDGVILTGGNDVHPSSYGSLESPSADASQTRDRTEHALLGLALARGLPVLGICRGMQFLNVYFGGTVLTDLSRHDAWPRHQPGMTHVVDVVERRAAADLGVTRFEVNSFHRQAVTQSTLAADLQPFARAAESDIVEGLFHPSRPVAGVQYHPERRDTDHPVDTRLVEAFRTGGGFWS